MAKKNAKMSLKAAAPEPEPESASNPIESEPVESTTSEEPAEPKSGETAKSQQLAKEKEKETAKDPIVEIAQAETAKAEPAEQAPPVPRRPPSPFSKALKDLKEAFPDAETSTSRAILVAASGNLEQAFNGMLALSDDTIRPAPAPAKVEQSTRQIRHDEQLARQLAQQYNRRSSRTSYRSGESDRTERFDRRGSDYDGDFTENLSRGLNDTKEMVTSFWGQLKERFNNEIFDDDDDQRARRRGPGRESGSGLYDESSAPPRPPRRSSSIDQTGSTSGPLNAASTNANTASANATASSRLSPLHSGNTDKGAPVNAFGDTKPAQIAHAEGSTKKKWEPLSRDEPEPDAFFIGESDDDDLGSLEETDKPAETEPEPETEPQTKEDTKTAPAKSARDMLNKLKEEAKSSDSSKVSS